MRKSTFYFLQLAFLCIASNMLAQVPTAKVDLSITGRSDDETLEPGYTVWRVGQGASDSKEIDGITYTFSAPEGASYIIRTGWNKSFIQNADNKAKNGRLTGDGLSLDPATGEGSAGELILTITGLPKGTHSLQTYHNRWENPDNFVGWPIFVKVNGELVHSKVETTFWKAVSTDATLLTSIFTVENDGDPVTISFYTLEDEKPANVAEKTKYNMAPIINGFELNTVEISTQAKNPDPTSGNIHVDADSKEYLLSWSPANQNVATHYLYIGTDSVEVDNMTTPTATKEANDTTYLITDLYSMNTYWWRVDEVDAGGKVAKGQIWSFKPRQLAFPDAEGYGRYAQGGRGGMVYHVTNLNNDHNPGSLLYGLKDLEGPRTIVFDVSGLIVMDFSSVFTDKYITLAPQTAPGKGICLKHCNLGFTNENIVRHLRARRGYGDTGNAMGCGSDNCIIDHCSALWGTDETFSTREGKNLTFQYSMIAEALGIADHKNYDAGKNHGFAATIGGEVGTFSHNLLINCQGRNWSLGGGLDGAGYAKGKLDIFNNVCYNWGGRATDGGAHEVNFVANYYKVGPANGTKCLLNAQLENIGLGTQSYHVKGNIRQEINNGKLTQDKLGDTYKYTLYDGKVLDWQVWSDVPFFPSYATIHTAEQAFKIVMSNSGATMPCRDDQHKRMQYEAVSGTYTYTGSRSGIKGQIDNESDCGGFEAFPEESRDADWDTDQDGIPNWYEKLVGTDVNVANNNDDPDKDGWTQLEDYIEFMSHPYIIIPANSEKAISLKEHFYGFTNSPEYSVENAETSLQCIVADTLLTVKSGAVQGLFPMTMTVTDADGDSYSQRLTVAVTDDNTAVPQIFDEKKLSIAKREFFTVDGRQVSTMQSGEVYIMKITETSGNVQSVKIIKD